MTDLSGDWLGHLRQRLSQRQPLTVDDALAQRAAVAVVAAAGPEPSLLLVRRVERAGDPWSGHIAFPGGFRSAGDATPEATACREAEEETGLPLARLGSWVGRLDDVSPRSPLLPRIVVTPVVYSVSDRYPVAASQEVAEAIWVPVASLRHPGSRKPLEVAFPTGPRTFDSIQTHGLTIWGLTERVIAQIIL